MPRLVNFIGAPQGIRDATWSESHDWGPARESEYIQYLLEDSGGSLWQESENTRGN